MRLSIEFHGIDRVHVGLPHAVFDVAASLPWFETGVQLGVFADFVVGVGANEGAGIRVHHFGSVAVHHVQTDREKLHDLTGKILICIFKALFLLPNVCGALAVHVRQHFAHHRRVRNFFQYVSVVPKGMPHEDIVVRHKGFCHAALGGFHGAWGDDQQLRQRPCDSLPELVGGLERDFHPHTQLLCIQNGVVSGLASDGGSIKRPSTEGATAKHQIVGNLVGTAAGDTARHRFDAGIGDGRWCIQILNDRFWQRQCDSFA
mmetsp:Transcript_11505/g.33018  ORF Transcript_11505/g.33018 Transcript_11505/m.33018 type:complete len:260 (+) Transcript_11505:3087-3866(+)